MFIFYQNKDKGPSHQFIRNKTKGLLGLNP